MLGEYSDAARSVEDGLYQATVTLRGATTAAEADAWRNADGVASAEPVGLAQGLIGYVQYFTDLPWVLVAVHLVGAAVLLAVATRLVLLARPAAS